MSFPKRNKFTEAKETTVIESDNLFDNRCLSPSTYPHCVLPPHFFERAVYLTKRNLGEEIQRPRTVLSVQTWDGRDVMEVTSD